MKIEYIVLGIISLLLAMSPSFAASISVEQPGADTGTIMKGQYFTITVSGLSGSGSISLIDTPSGFSSEEGTTKSFSEGTESVTWTTTKLALVQSSIQMKASISVQGSPSIAESPSFDVVLPPSISLAVTPDAVAVNEGSSYTVTLNVQNSGGTSAKSVAFSVSGSGMSGNCPTISSIAIGASSSITCEVTAATSGTIMAIFAAEPSNCEAKSGSVSVTVADTGGDSPGGGDNSPGGGSPGVGVGSVSSYWLDTFSVSDGEFTAGFSKILLNKQRVKVKVGSADHYVGIVSISSNSATINISSTPQQATLNIGEERKFDVSGSGYYEVYVKLNSVTNTSANLTIRKIFEKIPFSGNQASNGDVSSGQPSDDGATSQVCAQGTVRCTGGEIQNCINGEWSVQEVCQYSCQEGSSTCNTYAGQPPQAGIGNWSMYAFGAIVLIIAAIALMAIMKKKPQEKPNTF